MESIYVIYNFLHGITLHGCVVTYFVIGLVLGVLSIVADTDGDAIFGSVFIAAFWGIPAVLVILFSPYLIYRKIIDDKIFKNCVRIQDTEKLNRFKEREPRAYENVGVYRYKDKYFLVNWHKKFIGKKHNNPDDIRHSEYWHVGTRT